MKRTAAEPGSDVRIVNVRPRSSTLPARRLISPQVSSMAHSQVAPDTFAIKDAVNKNFGDDTRGKFQTYGTHIQ
jgi:hypothetical protein